jgi:hypothetical protein
VTLRERVTDCHSERGGLGEHTSCSQKGEEHGNNPPDSVKQVKNLSWEGGAGGDGPVLAGEGQVALIQVTVPLVDRLRRARRGQEEHSAAAAGRRQVPTRRGEQRLRAAGHGDGGVAAVRGGSFRISIVMRMVWTETREWCRCM